MHRLRIIAGPNGSGKTTLTKDLMQKYDLNLGVYINADEIEDQLRRDQKISLRKYGLSVREKVFLTFYNAHELRPKSSVTCSVRYNVLRLDQPLSSNTYFPALLADFIRQCLLDLRQTFSFETVMSGGDKIQLLKLAKKLGYRTYLYFICIEKDSDNTPTANFKRVRDRVLKSGHNVPENLISSRYEKTLANLLPAIKLSDRAYLFDNSGAGYQFVAEITNGRELEFNPDFVPRWFELNVLNQ